MSGTARAPCAVGHCNVFHDSLCLLSPQIKDSKSVSMILKYLKGINIGECHITYRILGKSIILTKPIQPITPTGSLAHVWILDLISGIRGSTFKGIKSANDLEICMPRCLRVLTLARGKLACSLDGGKYINGKDLGLIPVHFEPWEPAKLLYNLQGRMKGRTRVREI